MNVLAELKQALCLDPPDYVPTLREYMEHVPDWNIYQRRVLIEGTLPKHHLYERALKPGSFITVRQFSGNALMRVREFRHYPSPLVGGFDRIRILADEVPQSFSPNHPVYEIGEIVNIQAVDNGEKRFQSADYFTGGQQITP